MQSTPTRRKYIRIAMSLSDDEAFQSAKRTAEDATGIQMSDSMFALSLIRHAIKDQ